MDLALSPTTPGLTVAELADLCRYAEELGYRQVWSAEVAGPDAFVLTAAAARVTERMEFGVAVVPAYTRTPAALAMAAGSVSQLLDGRPFRLGIGASSEVIVRDWHGQDFNRPIRRVAETIAAIRSILSGEPGFRGKTVSTNRYRLASPPSGPVECHVAALREGMLRLAGRVGDGVCLNLMPPGAVPRQLAEVRAGAEEVGRGLPDDYGVMARLQVVVTDDAPAARDMLRDNFIGPYMAQPVYNRFLSWLGYEEEAQAIATGWAARDREAVGRAIHDRLVDDLALVGSASAVRDRLDEFAAAGLKTAALMVIDRSAVEDTLRALAPS
ncbi:MAG TPA: LLM class F420-dependent oxidoreductase [Acidimicrobiia bacterium]